MSQSQNQVLRAWEERVVSKERGSRIVHYTLRDSTTNSLLAVVGIEKSRNHMIYSVTEDYLRVFGSTEAVHSETKWKARKDVVEFLMSITSVGGPIFAISNLQTPHMKYLTGLMTRLSRRTSSPSEQIQRSRQKIAQNEEVVWSGDASMCDKQLKHYPAFSRNGIDIAVHSFVWILFDQGKEYPSYVEDLYENQRREKMARVRPFLMRGDIEVLIPNLNPRCREVFITSTEQEISAQRIDGLAFILIPSHFDKCVEVLPPTLSFRTLLCHREFKNNRTNTFNLNQIHGYFNQPIHSLLKSLVTAPCNDQEKSASGTESGAVPNGTENIEVLSEDIGNRGCWLRCKILCSMQNRIKVQHYNIADSSGLGKLEDWIEADRVAGPDTLGVRIGGRLTVRPWPPHSEVTRFEVGAAVDSWWRHGWWEGVVIGYRTSDANEVQVFFPGEKMFMTVERKNVRASKEWMGNEWVDVRSKHDILDFLTALFGAARRN